MSPEQEVAGSYLRPASDIYSLGLILFEMLTGRGYKSLRPGTRLKSLSPDSPAWLDDLLLRMLSDNPKDRPWDGDESAELLKRGNSEPVKNLQDEEKKNRIAEAPDVLELQKKAEEDERSRRKEDIFRLEAQCKIAIENQDWNLANQVVSTLNGMGYDGRLSAQHFQSKIDYSKEQNRPSLPFWKKYWYVGVIGLGVLLLSVLFSSQPSQSSVSTISQPGIDLKPFNKNITMCFSQLGAESDWRTAMTASIKETAKELGVNLIFSDAQQKQENQISAIRSCISRGVDIIALSPVVEDGWDEVLQEAKNVSIPVILLDRAVSSDPSLYTTHIGSHMEIEGEKAGSEMNKLFPNGGKIVELQGTTGSGAALGRADGFRRTLQQNIQIMDTKTANFTRDEGKSVMKSMLERYGRSIDGIFAHNDDMAIGAIEALNEAGYKPGEIKIVSVDGTKGAFQAMVDGWISVDVECNPMLGPQTMDTARKILNGEQVDKEILSIESIFYQNQAASLVASRRY
jgi:simple sugar transport system substrate-binding protein